MIIDDTYIRYEDIEEPLNGIMEPGVPNYNNNTNIIKNDTKANNYI